MSAAKNKTKFRAVVDGSNIATEGRTIPSLAQLLESVTAFEEEHPGAEVLVVVDATMEHRVAPAERARLKELELEGRLVAPPAGSIGRGDAFILKIAERINAVVLSNDSFQEFQDEHPWLFQEGRLIGGKPVPKVGWIFTPRLPVKAAKRTTGVKKLTVALPDGVQPTIGTTLTPKAVKAVKAVKAEPKIEPAKSARAAKKAPAEKSPAKKATKAVAKKAVAKKAPTTTDLPAAVRRERAPVNGEEIFTAFLRAYKLRAQFDGKVAAFTSHGAVINVVLDRGVVECYAPTTSLGSPAPARARDVLKRGETRRFRLVAVDKERRIAELALA